MPDLDVFVSWSGTLSHEAALDLYDWLPCVLPGIKPWISSENIAKGKPWFATIASQLGKSPICVICVTEKNACSPWLHYEAGAIAFSLDDPHVCPLLINTMTDAISGTPLGQFQATRFEREDVFRLVRTINGRLPSCHDETLLRTIFDKKWPALKKKVDKLIAAQPKDSLPSAPPIPPPAPLSDEASQILLTAFNGKPQVLTMSKTLRGFGFCAGGKALATLSMDDRQEARYRAVVKELLDREMIDDRGTSGTVFGLTNAGYTVAEELQKLQPPTLSDEAKKVLTEAAAGDGKVMMLVSSEGFHLQVNGRAVCESKNARIEAVFRAAVKYLANCGLLDPVGYKGEIFQVTDAGYKLADELIHEAAVTPTPAVTDEADILVHLQGWMHQKYPNETRTPPITYSEVDCEMNLPPGAAAKLLERAARKLNWTPASKGPKVIVFMRVGAPGSAPQVINPRLPG